MSESNSESRLEQLLTYADEPAADEFVLQVMHRVGNERRLRKLILLAFGLAGALFGIIGALLLSDSITQLFSNLPVTGTMQAVLFVCGSAAFYTWFMNDDMSLPS